MRKITFDTQLTVVFISAIILMSIYEFLKEIAFNGALAPWESHIITIVVTATLTTFASFFVRKWAINVNEQYNIAAIAFESKEGMVVTDANGIILRVNHAFTKITGYKAEEVIGSNPRLHNPLIMTQISILPCGKQLLTMAYMRVKFGIGVKMVKSTQNN